nr:MAG TPA: hypothetical protein [Caudoviricetes sp.]
MKPLAATKSLCTKTRLNKNETTKHRVRAFRDYANFSGNAVYYRGRNNTSSDYGLFYINNNSASNYNSNIGSRILGQKRQS